MGFKRHFTVKQWLACILMELLILLVTGLFVWFFVDGLRTAKASGHGVASVTWFCLACAIIVFIGLNVAMVFIIRAQRKKAQ